MINRKVFLLFLIGFFLILTGFLIGRLSKESPIKENSVVERLISRTASILRGKESSSLTKTATTEAKVVRVIDGDTIQVQFSNQTETVRLIGIDTPETVDPRKPVQCFGREASDYAKGLLAGRIVSLEFDGTQGDRDKYHRLLAVGSRLRVLSKLYFFYPLEIPTHHWPSF